MNTHNQFILTGTCFIAGVLRMWGTFECFSTLLLRITPSRTFALFFCVIYSVILGCVQLSGIITVYLTDLYSWQYMHYFIVGLLLIVALISCLLLRPFRVQEALPLKGIDWLGGILWSVILLLLIFVFNYGEHYDWLDSPHIQLALFAALLLGIIHFFRIRQLRNPYINMKIVRYPHVFTVLFLFTAMFFFLSTPTVLQNAYTAAILHFDSLHTISLNWAVLAGLLLGSLFTWLTLVRLHWKYKTIVFIGLALLVANQVLFYFLISPDTSKEMLYLPLVFRGAGNMILYIVLTFYCSQVIPFNNMFQALAILGFIRNGIGTPMATALIGRLFTTLQKANYLSLSSELDAQNPVVNNLSFNTIYGEVQRQALMVSIKEVFGYVVIFGILLLLAFLLTKYPPINKYVRMPVFSLPRRLWEIKLFRRPIYTVKELLENGRKS
jgi:MFS family permease